jgi:hypothetical protein
MQFGQTGAVDSKFEAQKTRSEFLVEFIQSHPRAAIAMAALVGSGAPCGTPRRTAMGSSEETCP